MSGLGRVFRVAIYFCYTISGCVGQGVSKAAVPDLRLLPQPQQTNLRHHLFTFDSGWQVLLDPVISPDDVAVESLRDQLKERFGIRLGTRLRHGVLRLHIRAGAIHPEGVQERDAEAISAQAYSIDLHPDVIDVTGNTATALFYGVETFVQLLQSQGSRLWLPEGTVRDWPQLQMRHIFWDLSHHLEPIAELERNIRQAAFYKVNGFVLKLDGHFNYQSAPAAVEPYALTRDNLQQLTDYALHYHIQLIPYLDGPGHLAFLLKHPEFANLRASSDSNYEICASNPDSYKLLERLYQDLLDGNKGGHFFYLSTDEAYYLGLAQSKTCNERYVGSDIQSPGQVFSRFVTEAGAYLHARGRVVVFWGEYPLGAKDIPALPKYLISGETYGKNFDSAFAAVGIRQMIYTSGEGEELLFPDYSLLPEHRRLHPDYKGQPRVQEILEKISPTSSQGNQNIIGEVNASWSDEGVHPETFWLGYVASAAAGWHPGALTSNELTGRFYSTFYGAEIANIDQIYHLLSNQAQVYADSWETVTSRARKPLWGDSDHINRPPKPAKDQALILPPSPNDGLLYVSDWPRTNAVLPKRVVEALIENERLLLILHQAVQQARFNRYNLEIYRTIASLCRQNLLMIDGVRRMDADLRIASEQRITNPSEALRTIDDAVDVAEQIRLARNVALADTVESWSKSWLPRVPDANGRHFLHVLDDVKDHLPDRTIDMSYLVYRETILPFGEWVGTILAARNSYAATNDLPLRCTDYAWSDLTILGRTSSGKRPAQRSPTLARC